MTVEAIMVLGQRILLPIKEKIDMKNSLLKFFALILFCSLCSCAKNQLITSSKGSEFYTVEQKKELNKYGNEVRKKISAHWEIPNNDIDVLSLLTAKVDVKINRAGEITKVNLVHSSGKLDFDESCLQAIKKTKTLPLPPKHLEKEAFEEGFIIEFDPGFHK